MNASFTHFTEDLGELLLVSLSNSRVDFSKIEIKDKFDQNNLEMELLLHILNRTECGILVDCVLNHYVGLFYYSYEYLFFIDDITDYEQALRFAYVELLNHDKLKPYLEIQAMRFKHGLNP
jgi:hypothetical protein